MKKLLPVLAILVAFSACTKEAATPQTTETNVENGKVEKDIKATVSYYGDPATDGFGWVLRTTENDFEIPTNLSADFQKQDLSVIVSYKVTNQKWVCRCTNPKFMVEITTIRKADL